MYLVFIAEDDVLRKFYDWARSIGISHKIFRKPNNVFKSFINVSSEIKLKQ